MDESSVIALPDAVELRHLRAFLAVAEELNFGRAAARLYVSQPALSRQIRSLERLLGAELLRRSTHRVELTLAGEALRPRAEDVLTRVADAVAATRAVGGELIGRASRHWGAVREAIGADAGVQELRDAVEAMHARFSVPEEITVRSTYAGGVPSLVLSASPEHRPTVLYLHGGGYMLGSAFGYRPLAGAIALAAGTAVVLPEYRLAPEHPFPAALRDAVRAYGWLVEQAPSPGHIVLAGDSTGSAMALALMLSLADEDLPMPGGAALLCPGLDLTAAHIDPADGAEIIAHLARARELYLDGHPVDDPLVSPLLADLTGLPPLLIQSATGDVASREARLLLDRATAHGVDARFELYPADTHQFQMFWSFLPEAAEAVSQVGAFVRGTSARDVRTA